MKYLLPLFLISFCGFAAEPPVVKSKAAKELLKHPEFKKALEAAPELGKLLSALDKDAFMGARALKPLGKQLRWTASRLTVYQNKPQSLVRRVFGEPDKIQGDWLGYIDMNITNAKGEKYSTVWFGFADGVVQQVRFLQPEKAELVKKRQHAPAPAKKLTLTGVISWDTDHATIEAQKTIKLPRWNALDYDWDKIQEQIAILYDGWTLEKWKSVFGKPDEFKLEKDAAGKEYFWMIPVSGHRFLHNTVTETVSGGVWYHVDKATFRIVRTRSWRNNPFDDKTWVTTPYGKKLGYK